MKVAQVAEIVNNLTAEILGEGAPTAADDLSNVVDIGKAIFDATSVDNYVHKLVDHIGRVVFVNRPYSGRAPSVRMEGWEYGSVLEKIDADIPEAKANQSWNLVDGQNYAQDTFNSPKGITVTFWNDRVTFDIEMSFTDMQVKSAFSNGAQLNAFFSMIYTKIDMSMTIKLDSLIMATINNFIANVYTKGGAQSVNLLAKYKEVNPTSTVTAATAMYDLDFIKFAAYQFKLYSRRLTNASKVFNMENRVRHTPVDLQKIIMLDSFADAADVYLQSDTFHNELTKLPNADKISFWQYSGNNYDFADVSAIDIVPNTTAGGAAEVKLSGIIGVIFDRDALGVNNYNRRNTAHYNAAAEFTNMWFKMDAQYFNDFKENFVLFYVADTPAPEPEPEEP